MPLALENDTYPPSLTRPPHARPALLLPRGPGSGLVQGTRRGGKPWGASTPLSPGSLGRCGADFCYLLTIKVLRDALCASALGGGEGSCVCHAASLQSWDSVVTLPLLVLPHLAAPGARQSSFSPSRA